MKTRAAVACEAKNPLEIVALDLGFLGFKGHGGARFHESDGHGFVGRRSAAQIVVVERDQAIGFRIIGGDATARQRAGHRGKAADDPCAGGVKGGQDIDLIAAGQPLVGQVFGTDENNIATAKDTAIAIILAIDGGVVLVVAAQGRQQHHAGVAAPGVEAVGQPGQAAWGHTKGVIFADAILPHPGQSWFDTAPPQLASSLRAGAEFGMLPSWDRWWPPGALDQLVPDPSMREALISELTPLPLDYFAETAPASGVEGPAAFLRLSGAYDDEARAATRMGWPVVSLPLHHLAMLTHPEAVAGA
eukprot:gene10266-13807_t